MPQPHFAQRRVFANGQGHVEAFLLYSGYNKDPFLYIHNVYTKPTERNKGNAVKLLRSVIRFARKNGAYKIFAVCKDELVPVYRSAGLEVTGRQVQKVLA